MISELSFYGFVEVKNKINHKLDFGRFSSAAVYTNRSSTCPLAYAIKANRSF